MYECDPSRTGFKKNGEGRAGSQPCFELPAAALQNSTLTADSLHEIRVALPARRYPQLCGGASPTPNLCKGVRGQGSGNTCWAASGGVSGGDLYQGNPDRPLPSSLVRAFYAKCPAKGETSTRGGLALRRLSQVPQSTTESKRARTSSRACQAGPPKLCHLFGAM